MLLLLLLLLEVVLRHHGLSSSHERTRDSTLDLRLLTSTASSRDDTAQCSTSERVEQQE